MNTRSSVIHWPMVGILAVGLVLSVDTTARSAARHGGAHGGGHGGGHVAHAPRISAPRSSYKAPRMPRASAPSHMNVPRTRSIPSQSSTRASNHQGRGHNTAGHANHTANQANASSRGTQAHTGNGRNSSGSGKTVGNAGTTGGTGAATTAAVGARSGLANGSSQNHYTYGSGSWARPYRAYGYGRGYRNRYYGAGYGYGRSQGVNRGIVSRLRLVHAGLARIDHDYQGHRVRAMHAISMAIRQLSHRSMVYNGVGFASGMNNRMGMGQGMGQGGRRSVLGGGGGMGGRGRQPMNQAQSDARMSQALRTLQGVGMQLGNQGYNTMGHSRAMGHVQQAVRELNMALSIR